MKNEPIKTYALVASTGEALRIAEAGETLAFKNYVASGDYVISALNSIRVNNPHPYVTVHRGPFRYAFTVTELDPCQSPNSAFDVLKPWMAYVGQGKDIPESDGKYYLLNSSGRWNGGFCAYSSLNNDRSHYAIDVRTAWAQEHFPEHCRIRAYVAPCAIDVAWNAHSNGGACKFPREEHFRAGWKAAMSHAITNRQEILEKL